MTINHLSHPLLPHQRQALKLMRDIALQRAGEARKCIHGLLAAAGLDAATYDIALNRLRQVARINLHFHPDRLDIHGRSVAAGLLEDGAFRTQYETGISAGSTSAFVGGARDLWEEKLFGGAYHVEGAKLAERPRYGALNLLSHPDGAAPRFGACYFVLRQNLNQRASFTFGGSQEADASECSGTLDAFDAVMAALLAEASQGQGILGETSLDLPTLLQRLSAEPSPSLGLSARPLGQALDSFIEVQIHGAIELSRDVEGLVADPCYRGGPIEPHLLALGHRYGFEIDWHPGFKLALDSVPEQFRGFSVRPLAQRIATGECIDAAALGAAENDYRLHPDAWTGWGDQHEMLTRFRRLWHVLVLYGGPAEA
ncbi:MAG: DUF3626 domain-containing protein [Candidatus Melainabacteria bacterium HGW-Melainabacteria-1]|nr:MAG: DUF3626 domain-containing protein [Candidatus Melainabacteria bacterium HGW-Melainabacteria-1]